MALLSQAKTRELRANGLLKENENAIQVGDKIFAENFITFERRLIVDQAKATVSETKQLLKD